MLPGCYSNRNKSRGFRRELTISPGIPIENGISDPSVLEIQVKQATASCADEVILLMDSSKFGVRSLKTILPMSHIAALVTDAQPDASFVDWLRQENVELHVAS